MPRLYLKLMLSPLILFALIMLLIRVQPYDDQDVRTFLNPSGDCQMPCFMGIHPGITSFNEAAKILKDNPWVSKLTDQHLQGMFYWTWSGQQPAVIDDTYPGSLQSEETNPGLVSQISIPTRTSVGNISLVLGKLSTYELQFLSRGSGSNGDILAYYSINYLNYPVSINGSVSCTGLNIWNLAATLTYHTQPSLSDVDWAEQMRRNSWCK